MVARAVGDIIRAYINIFLTDKRTLERHYGRGWSGKCRDIIHDHCIYLRQRERGKTPIIGELIDD